MSRNHFGWTSGRLPPPFLSTNLSFFLSFKNSGQGALTICSKNNWTLPNVFSKLFFPSSAPRNIEKIKTGKYDKWRWGERDREGESESQLPRLRQEAESRCQVSMLQAWPGCSHGSVQEPCAALRGPARAPPPPPFMFLQLPDAAHHCPPASCDSILLRPSPRCGWECRCGQDAGVPSLPLSPVRIAIICTVFSSRPFSIPNEMPPGAAPQR